MWPQNPEDALRNEVPPFVEFLILHAREIFGDRLGPTVEAGYAVPQDSAPPSPAATLEPTNPFQANSDAQDDTNPFFAVP